MTLNKTTNTPPTTHYIAHADLDAFFASVEQIDNPSLQGKAVVVGGMPESRGVVAAASYEARAFGIKSAMPMKTALRYCPDLQVIPPRFERYREISTEVLKLFKNITPLVEPLSLDEAFLDITELVNSNEQAQALAERLRSEVRRHTGLTISIGIGTSKSIAKIASDLNKPNGLVLVLPGTEKAFLKDLPVAKLWGIGPKTSEKLIAKGITKIGDLSEKTDKWLQSHFGNKALIWKAFSTGKDARPVEINGVRKSISAETTLAQDSSDPEVIQDLVHKLSKRISASLHKHDLMAKTIKVKLRLSDFTNVNRQTTLDYPANSDAKIGELAFKLIHKELRHEAPIRLVGIGVALVTKDKDLQTQLQARIPGL
jgi:DNA polymerase-4